MSSRIICKSCYVKIYRKHFVDNETSFSATSNGFTSFISSIFVPNWKCKLAEILLWTVSHFTIIFLTRLNMCTLSTHRYEHHPLKVGAAFLRHEPKFYLYALYNKNKPKSDSLMSEYGSVFFKSKQIQLMDKMDLASYLLKPVQRMGKYALLLQQLMKACSKIECCGNQELIEDLEELKMAEEMVRFQLRHGNDLLAMDSLRDCDVNVKEQGRLLRQNEFLVWEGRGGKKSLRQVFLFEELVLFSKARRFPDRKVTTMLVFS